MRGCIDHVRPEGIADGWCWDPAAPDERVDVTVLVDGVEAGSGTAALFREDLREAKIGDGFHAFSVVLSGFGASKRRTQTFLLVRTSTREPIADPLVVHTKSALSFDDRLLELEARNRLLETRLAEMTQLAKLGVGSPDLFSVIGAFFMRLSEDTARGVSPNLERRLDDIVEAALRTHPAITLPVPANPVMTILIDASCSLTELYACLVALRRAGAGQLASVVVLDTGRSDDVALIPSIVRGIRYVRTAHALVQEWSEVELQDRNEILMLLGGHVMVSETCLQELRESFGRESRAGAFGPVVVGPDGLVVHGGLYLSEGELVDCGVQRPSPDVDLGVAHPVHALSHHAAAFRRPAFRSAGGLRAGFSDDVGAAIIDLCFRLRQGEWSVNIQPFAVVSTQPGSQGRNWITPSLDGPSRWGDLLRGRWFGAQSAPSPLRGGRALVVSADAPLADMQPMLDQLQGSNYAITYIGPKTLLPEQVGALQRAGITFATSDCAPALLAQPGADIVYAPHDFAYASSGSVRVSSQAELTACLSGREPPTVS